MRISEHLYAFIGLAMLLTACDGNEFDEDDEPTLPTKDGTSCDGLDNAILEGMRCLGIDPDGATDPTTISFATTVCPDSSDDPSECTNGTKLENLLTVFNGQMVEKVEHTDWGILAIATSDHANETFTFEFKPDASIQIDDQHGFGGCYSLLTDVDGAITDDVTTLTTANVSKAHSIEITAPETEMDVASPYRTVLWGYDQSGGFFRHDPKIVLRTKSASGTSRASNLPTGLQCCPGTDSRGSNAMPLATPSSGSCACTAAGQLQYTDGDGNVHTGSCTARQNCLLDPNINAPNCQ